MFVMVMIRGISKFFLSLINPFFSYAISSAFTDLNMLDLQDNGNKMTFSEVSVDSLKNTMLKVSLTIELSYNIIPIVFFSADSVC